MDNAEAGLPSPEAWMVVAAAQQRQQVEEHQQVLQHLAEQQCNLLAQLVVAQAQTGQQLWDHVTQAVQTTPGKPAIRIPRMTSEADPEAFLNSFECSA